MLAFMMVTFDTANLKPDLMLLEGEDVTGYVVCSETPPPAPPDTIVVQVEAPEALITTLHNRMQAADPRLGIYVALEA